MPRADAAFWSDRVRQVLKRYDEPLLRQVAARLFKPRNQWPLDDLVERNAATLSNAAVIDRRLEALEPEARRILALIGHSRQPRWQVGSLMELLVSLGYPVDMHPIFALLEAGLLFPDLPEPVTRLKSFEQWLGLGHSPALAVFAHPDVMTRALGGDLGLPECPGSTSMAAGLHEADGLEWPLRLAALWQQVAAGPMRRTQQGDFFKRDLDRLRADPLLNAPPADSLADLPDMALLTIELAQIEGLLRETDGELRSLDLPASWEQGLPATLESLWTALPQLSAWNAREGWRGTQPGVNPYPSAYLLALLLLTRLPEDGWADPKEIERWILEHHPYWAPTTSAEPEDPEQDPRPIATSRRQASIDVFLLGLAYQLRLLQAARNAEGAWVVRLAPMGRSLLGLAELPATPHSYSKTLLVQPNLEIIAYRQGLTPGLVGRLSQLAAWKTLGSACTLQLQPDTVYRALETGQTFETILQTLEQHGMRPTPPAVVESLRTWADKRERLAVYASATLFEFASAEEANEALARGLPGVRFSDRLVVVANENSADFRHFRLAGTRDYGLPPEKCVEVESDGVTLTIDLVRSDLLVETELQRFAEWRDTGASNGRRQYRLTPATLTAARTGGMGLRNLEDWFQQRTGQGLPPAARLLLTAPLVPTLELRRQVVLHVSTPDVADGLLQWPATRELIQSRLGPSALAVAEEHVDELRQRLAVLGMSVEGGEPSGVSRRVMEE